MLSICRLALLCCAVVVVAADEWTEAFGPIDAVAIARDADLLPLCSMVVRSVGPGSVADKAGLRAGDLLVGLDGLRIHGSGEYDLVRFQRPCTRGEMRLAVWRDGGLVTCATRDAQAVQRLGFDFGDPPGALERALRELAVPACGWESFPRRDGVALLRWSAAAPPTADRTWIAGLARLYALLAEQRWAEAATVVVQPPEPDLAVLADFYHRLALRHAAGEQEPDPARLGRSCAWYTIHYPYPRLSLPALGTFTHPDPAFMAALRDVAEDPAGAHHDPAAACRAMAAQDDEGSYAWRSRCAVIDPARHRDWPFRHEDIANDGPRGAVIATLRAQVAAGGALAQWSRFSLVTALLIQQRGVDGPERTRPFMDALDEVRADAPLLGYFAALNASRALGVWHVNGASEAFIAAIVARPFPLTAQPSRFLDHLRARDAGLAFQLMGPEECRWPAHLSKAYAALARETTVADLRRRLAAAGAADRDQRAPLDLAQRTALMAAGTECFRDAALLDDATLLAGIGAPGAGAGLLTDALSELFYRQTADEEVDANWWTMPRDALDRLTAQPAAVAGMRAAIAAIPWSDAQALVPAVRAADAAWGTGASLLVLAEACAGHGQGELAAAMRQRVVVLYQRLRACAQRVHLNRDWREDFECRLLILGVLSPATVPEAIAAGERCGQRRTPEQEWDSVQLGLALAHLAAGRRDDALAALCRSFEVGRTDPGPVLYWCDGEPLTDTRASRTWILRRVLAAGPLPEVLRKMLLGRVRSALVDDAFLAALGVERKALPGDPRSPTANDF